MKISKGWIHILAIFAMLFWGLSFIWSKIVFQYYGPVTTIFLRLIISGSLLYAITRLSVFKQKIQKQDWKYLFILALFQPFLYFLCESFGLNLVTSSVASVIIATIPVFTPIFAYLFVKERLSMWSFAGMMVSFVGVILMIINKDFSLSASPLGILLLFGAVCSAIAYSVVIKKLVHQYSSITIITYQNLIGIIYFLPVFLIFDFENFIKVQPNRELIAALLQLSIFASSLAYIFLVPVIKGIGINRTNIYTNLIPVFTAFFAYFLLGETLTMMKIWGILLVVAGVSISGLKKIMIEKS